MCSIPQPEDEKKIAAFMVYIKTCSIFKDSSGAGFPTAKAPNVVTQANLLPLKT